MLERFWDSKEKLNERLRILESEIAGLSAKLNDVNQKKELWFAKKEELKKQLQDNIKQLREIKIKKDSVSVDIQKLKKERNEYNKTVSELISKSKILNKEREEIYKKTEVKINPEAIRSKIEAMERMIETEVMSFSKEQKIMKQIKKLKNQYGEMNEVSNVIGHMRQLSAEIDNTKNKAQELHKQIQEYAKRDEEGYNDFIELSRKINDVRQEQESAFKKFVKLKRIYIEVNNTLRNKLEETGKIKKKLDRFVTDRAVKSRDAEIEMLKEKLKYVEDKLKKGEKLTTEDILLFQKGSD